MTSERCTFKPAEEDASTDNTPLPQRGAAAAAVVTEEGASVLMTGSLELGGGVGVGVGVLETDGVGVLECVDVVGGVPVLDGAGARAPDESGTPAPGGVCAPDPAAVRVAALDGVDRIEPGPWGVLEPEPVTVLEPERPGVLELEPVGAAEPGGLGAPEIDTVGSATTELPEQAAGASRTGMTQLEPINRRSRRLRA